jgi:hypothetical protein
VKSPNVDILMYKSQNGFPLLSVYKDLCTTNSDSSDPKINKSGKPQGSPSEI